MKKKDTARIIADVAFVVGILIIFGMGILIGTKAFPEKIKEIVYIRGEEKTASINVPGVNQQGEGVMTELTAMLKPGNGQVLVNVNDVIAGYELQVFARNAVHAAGNATGTVMQGYDVSFSMKTDAGVIDGGSASAAMAVLVMAMLENKEISKEAAMTGAVDNDGKIMPVGLVDKKAEAAKQANISVLIVPAGQGGVLEQTRKESCTGDYCEITYMPLLEGSAMGVPIKEVATLQEALEAVSIESVESIKEEYNALIPVEATKKQHALLSELGVNLKEYSSADVIVSGSNIFIKVNCTAIPAVTTFEQANSIAGGIYKKVLGRPNAHDTAAAVFDSFGIDIIGVAIDGYEAGYFTGRLFALKEGKLLSVDAKPSDAVAIGARFDSPIYVNNKLLEEKGVNAC
ncbi:MAG: bifunctional nuclease family protein [Nanoarchaeota archaeon]|nr:bifunctional nuclease family protein [Nanoarchaeota archaeon]